MSSPHRQIPISLGKPSLRQRLEAYYQLIAPQQLSKSSWKTTFASIYEKYGGSYQGETLLRAKLEKKYGRMGVRLLIVVDPEEEKKKKSHVQGDNANKRPEEWFQPTAEQSSSGVLDLTSSLLDARAILEGHNDENMLLRNTFLKLCPRMNNLGECRQCLPEYDPEYRPPKIRKVAATPSAAASKSSDATKTGVSKIPSIFAPYCLEQGPFELLKRAMLLRKRVRVVTRYVNGIRGTLTGYLVVYDKHWNLILKDVLEVYTLRQDTERTYQKSNLELEVLRRTDMSIKQRRLPQLLVRGDVVVMVYLAEAEQSAYPVTSKSPRKSMYNSGTATDVPNRRLGTIGSLHLSQQRGSSKKRKGDFVTRK